jgi:hypothetical protein
MNPLIALVKISVALPVNPIVDQVEKKRDLPLNPLVVYVLNTSYFTS